MKTALSLTPEAEDYSSMSNTKLDAMQSFLYAHVHVQVCTRVCVRACVRASVRIHVCACIRRAIDTAILRETCQDWLADAAHNDIRDNVRSAGQQVCRRFDMARCHVIFVQDCAPP